MAHDSGSASPPGPGGFIQEQQPAAGLISPSPSLASNTARARTALGLPHPRSRALPSGSQKEAIVRRYASDRIQYINRRFIKKYAISDPATVVVGYKSMAELCADVDDVLNNLWKSGTPNLQVQYLLHIGSELITWMDGFPPSPRATLAILRKLDYCFASLLRGKDLETNEPLPGFERGVRRAGMTQTDMVRCRSIAEQTRIAVIDVFQRGPPDPLDEAGGRGHRAHAPPVTFGETIAAAETDTESMAGTETETETETEPGTTTRETTAEPAGNDTPFADFANDSDSDLDEDEQMGVARVYEFTLVRLGEDLGEGYGRIGDFAPPSPPPPQPCASDADASMELDLGDNDDDEY